MLAFLYTLDLREFDVAGLVHDSGVQGAAAAGLGLSTHAVVVAGCANGKWSAVALGVDGGGKTCVVAKYFGFVDFCLYINRSRKQTV